LYCVCIDYNIWVAWRWSYKRYELLFLQEYMGSPSKFGGVRVAHIFKLSFVLFFFVLCTLCCQFLWIVHSVFSNVYLLEFHHMLHIIPVWRVWYTTWAQVRRYSQVNGPFGYKINVRKNRRGNQEWTIQRHWKHQEHKTQDKDKTWAMVQTRHAPCYKQDMSPATNKTWTLLQTGHEPSHKQDMSPAANRTWALPQTRHEPSHKQDMNPHTNKTWALLQTTESNDHLTWKGGGYGFFLK
jgi:hypothetical protein